MAGKKKIIIFNNDKLYNAILPLFIFELWYIILALIFVVVIETFIISKYLKIDYKLTWRIILNANIISTIGGFFLQGLIRLVLGISLYYNYENYSKFPVLDIIFSNIAHPNNSELTSKIIIDLVISIFITLLISIIMEYKSFRLLNMNKELNKRTILKSIILANIISYSLLSIWIIFRIKLF